MNAKQLFKKTMPFCMAKLTLGAIQVGICLVLFGILMGIGWLFDGAGIFICFMIWLASLKIVNLAIMNYGGYLVKAGHIAVIAEAAKNGKIPENQVAYGKNMVKQRFVTANVYFAVDKLVSAAVKEVQRGIEKVGRYLDFIPGIDAVEGLVKFFVELSLGYVDECCLGWTFYNQEQNAYKSAADGVVLYAQNWKSVLKTAAMTMIKVVIGLVVLVVAIFVVIGLLFKLLGWNSFIAFCIACLLAWIVKFAFIDSYMMCQSMGNYLAVAPNTELTFDLYGKLCAMSSKFKELFNQGQKEAGEQTMSEAQMSEYETTEEAAPAAEETEEVYEEPAPTPARSYVFCGECGAKNDAKAAFCGECGAKLTK